MTNRRFHGNLSRLVTFPPAPSANHPRSTAERDLHYLPQNGLDHPFNNLHTHHLSSSTGREEGRGHDPINMQDMATAPVVEYSYPPGAGHWLTHGCGLY